MGGYVGCEDQNLKYYAPLLNHKSIFLDRIHNMAIDGFLNHDDWISILI